MSAWVRTQRPTWLHALRALLGALGLWLLPADALADVRIDVQTDRTSITLDDSLTLQITVQSEGGGSPDVRLPEFEGFAVVSQQVQRPMQFSFSFGSRTTVRSSTVYTFQLQPTRVGNLTIKPVRAELDGQVKTSQPVRITVSAGSAAAPAVPADPQADAVDPGDGTQAAQPPAQPVPNGRSLDNTQFDSIAFVRTVVDKVDPYEGEQVTVTIYLYVREGISSSLSITAQPTADGFWVHDLIDPSIEQKPTRQLVGDNVYQVTVLRRFAAFALHSGDLTLGPLATKIEQLSMFSLFGPRQRKQIERSGLPTTLHVKPLPPEGRPQGEVAVGSFTVTSKLDRAQVTTGDAVTLTATVQGKGNIRTISLPLPSITGLDVLQPETKDLVESPSDLVGGTREYRWLLVARQPGHFTIPALTLQTFDPESGSYRAVSSAPLAVDVVGNALPPSAAAGTPAGADGKQADPTAIDAPVDHTWAPVRTRSNLQRGYRRLVARPFFGWALLAPALLWLGVVLGGAVRQRMGARQETAEGRALRRAQHHWKSAELAARDAQDAQFYVAASAALHDQLEARLGEAVTGLTRRQLDRLLEERGMDEQLRKDALAMLERCELARFGAGHSGSLETPLAELRGLLDRVRAFAPAAQGGRA